MPIEQAKASELIDRYQTAVRVYERAHGDAARIAREEEAQARKALFEALTKGGGDA